MTRGMTTLRLDRVLQGALATAGLGHARDLLAWADPPASHNVGRRVMRAVDGTSESFYLKAYRYPGWAKSRGLIGRGSLWGRAPCVREFDNLAWLRARDVPVPRAIAAAAVTRRLRLCAHALLTEWVPNAPSLASRLTDRDDLIHTCRDAVLDTVDHTVRAMHALGFAHRDLFARNILVRLRTNLPPEIFLLDCRRGGPAGRAERDREHDALRRSIASLL